MHDFCPLCMKNGAKKRVKLLQINLQEAVWTCEAEKCVWPFGYEDFIFFPRNVGKTWSCYWDDQKPPVRRIKENLPISLSSLPPRNDEAEHTDILPLDGDVKEGCSIKDKDMDDGSIECLADTVDIESDAECVNIKNETSKCLANQSVNNDKLKGSEDTKNIDLTVDARLDSPERKRASSVQALSMKAVPVVTKIEKTNIDLTNVKIDTKAPTAQNPVRNGKSGCELGKETSTIVKSKVGPLDPVANLPKRSDVLAKDIQNKSSEVTKRPNLNVTTVKIDGLPPITLSYEIPLSTTLPKTVVSSTPKKRVLLGKRNPVGGKQYEKFSFSALKKKTGNDSPEKKSANSSDGNVDTASKNEKDSPANVAPESNSAVTAGTATISTATIVATAATTATVATAATTTTTIATTTSSASNQDNRLSMDTSIANTSDCIDNVLEDFLSCDYSVSEHINDDWLDSLLS